MGADRPRRIQLRRTAGWRLPPGGASVARPTRWGNPFTGPDAADAFRRWATGGPMSAQEWHDRACPQGYQYWEAPRLRADAVELLRGVPLACWCRPNQPCHADVLIEIANA